MASVISISPQFLLWPECIMKYALPSPLFCLSPFSVSKATFREVILPKSCTLDQCGTIHSPQRRQASELQILPGISCHRRRDILRYGYCDDPPISALTAAAASGGAKFNRLIWKLGEETFRVRNKLRVTFRLREWFGCTKMIT